MEDPYRIVKSLLQTEKGTALNALNKYLVHVDKRANKIEIKKAIETIYNVKVKSVNTISVPGKKKKVRHVEGMTPSWKKAVVNLQEGQKISEV